MSIKLNFNISKHLFYSVLLLLIPSLLRSQSNDSILLSKYTNEHLTDLSLNNSNRFAAIGNAIGDARIVFLGEQDHGDAPTFAFKSELIAYLHQNHGFDVLIFESDFYGLTSSYELYSNTDSVSSCFQNIYSIWTKCAECSGIFDYIVQQNSTENPLVVAGMDCQEHNIFSNKNLTSDLDLFLRRSNFQICNRHDYKNFTSALSAILGSNKKEVNSAIKKNFKLLSLYLNNLELEFSQNESHKNGFWHQTVRSLKSEIINLKIKGNGLDSDNVRDQQMAENLAWLLNQKFEGKKVMVWLHSGHAAKDMNKLIKTKKELITVGKIIDKKFGDDLYFLGFTSHSGTAGRLSQGQKNASYSVQAPGTNSLENHIYLHGFSTAFLPLDKENLPEKFNLKGVSHYQINAPWQQVMDGIIYIENMYPCSMSSGTF